MKKEYHIYYPSKEYTCTCGCNQIIKIKEPCHIIMGDFVKTIHIKQYLKNPERE